MGHAGAARASDPGASLDRQRFEQNAAELEAALALLVAESDAKNKDVMIRLIENMLALPTPAGA